MHKMLAVSLLGLLALATDAVSLDGIEARGIHAGRTLSLSHDEVRAPHAVARVNDENQTARRENEDFQAPLDDDQVQAPRGREPRAIA